MTAPTGRTDGTYRLSAAQALGLVLVWPFFGMIVDLVLYAATPTPWTPMVSRLVMRAGLAAVAAGSWYWSTRQARGRKRVTLRWFGQGILWMSLADTGQEAGLLELWLAPLAAGVMVLMLWAAVTFTRWLRPGIGDAWEESDHP